MPDLSRKKIVIVMPLFFFGIQAADLFSRACRRPSAWQSAVFDWRNIPAVGDRLVRSWVKLRICEREQVDEDQVRRRTAAMTSTVSAVNTER